MKGCDDLTDSVVLDNARDTLVIIDQTRLPNETIMLELKTAEDIYDAIKRLSVRGAPAIGIAAAYGLYLIMKVYLKENTDKEKEAIAIKEAFFEKLKSAKDYLNASRPTAVNLSWALNRMEQTAMSVKDAPVSEIMDALLADAEAIKAEDIQACKAIGENGLSLLKPGIGILTHCNAGALATSRYGTALSPIYLGNERGYNFKVYADETRPLLQGARLTAYELVEGGVDTTLICDNMASIAMKKGYIDAVLVGCDRVARNGDAANKIGTSGVAVLAKHYGIPFYVLGPTSTIDPGCLKGDDIVIEERDGSEITELWYEHRMAPKGVKTFNPAFDVTDHSLITAIITEKGVFYPPYEFK